MVSFNLKSDQAKKILDKVEVNNRNSHGLTKFSSLARNFDSDSNSEEIKPQDKFTIDTAQVIGRTGLQSSRVHSVNDFTKNIDVERQKKIEKQMQEKKAQMLAGQKVPRRTSDDNKDNNDNKMIKTDGSGEELDRIGDVEHKEEQHRVSVEAKESTMVSSIRPWIKGIPYNNMFPNLYQDLVFEDEIDWNNTKAFLNSPVVFGKTLMCNVYRYNKDADKSATRYVLTLLQNDRFIMNAQKQKKNVGDNFVISMKQDDFDKSSDAHIGKFRSNFWNTEYNVFDSGKNPKNATSPSEYRKQYAGITYVIL